MIEALLQDAAQIERRIAPLKEDNLDALRMLRSIHRELDDLGYDGDRDYPEGVDDPQDFYGV